MHPSSASTLVACHTGLKKILAQFSLPVRLVPGGSPVSEFSAGYISGRLLFKGLVPLCAALLAAACSETLPAEGANPNREGTESSPHPGQYPGEPLSLPPGESDVQRIHREAVTDE